MLNKRSNNHPQPTIERFGSVEAVVWGTFLGIIVTAIGTMVFMRTGSILPQDFWTFKYWGGTEVNRSAIIRNIVLSVLAIVALGLAAWRTWTADYQRRISERGMQIDRYQKGAEMLESKNDTLRIAGLYALRELAIADPKESYILVQSLIVNFIRERTKYRHSRKMIVRKRENSCANGHRYSEAVQPPEADMQEALNCFNVIRKTVINAKKLEALAGWRPNFRGINLSKVNFNKFDLEFADFEEANLSVSRLDNTLIGGANFKKANMVNVMLRRAKTDPTTNFTDSDLTRANLGYSQLAGTNFISAILSDASVSGTDFTGVNFSDSDLNGMYWGMKRFPIVDEIWATDISPPRNAPQYVTEAIRYDEW